MMVILDETIRLGFRGGLLGNVASRFPLVDGFFLLNSRPVVL